MSNILIVAPHADDEILGCGATMYKKIKEGNDVYVLIMTNASMSDSKLFPPELIKQVRAEAVEAHKLLGVKETLFLDFPAPALDQFPSYIMSGEVSNIIKKYTIDTVYVPHRGDIHKDHRIVYETTLVACRPTFGCTVKNIFAYETLSETEWAAPFGDDAFIPTVFETLTEDEINMKFKAMSCFKSQIRDFPNSRSLEALEALAKYRGATITAKRAEAFTLVRAIK